MKEAFDGIFEREGKLFTKNLVPGAKVYGEKLVVDNGVEYRQWDPFRSKLAAAVKNGLAEIPLKQGSNVLYLGAAEGTTLSHVSDIVGEKGTVFGVDVSERVMRKFIGLSEQRKNVIPIIADANRPWAYQDFVAGKKIDLLYQDVSQKNQARIFLKNAEYFLVKGSPGMLVVKVKSISQESDVQGILGKELAILSGAFKLKQTVNLKPFEKDHALVLCEKL